MPPRSQLGTAPARARVLVCDDSPSMRAYVQEILSPEYDVVLAATGEAALDAARTAPPDAVLCDVVLPGLGGTDVLRAFHADPALARIPFVLITAVHGEDARALGLEAGAADYLTKPIRPRELLARVASVVRLRRTMLEVEERSRALEEANALLAATHEALARAEKQALLGSLGAGLAHALNTPLAYVKSGANLLAGALAEMEAAARRAAAPDAPEGSVAALAEALAEGREIAADLSEGLARIERVAADLRLFGAPEGANVPVALDDAVRAAWDGARTRFAPAPRLVLSAEPIAPIVSSPRLVYHALRAMLEHAIARTPAGGAVTVEIEESDRDVEVRVADGGEPLTRDALKAFFRRPPADSGRAAAPSLGLAVASAIAHGLGGELEPGVHSASGTPLALRLPARRPPRLR